MMGAGLVAAQAGAAPDRPEVSAKVLAALAPVFAEISRVQREEAARPAGRSVAERLVSMGRLDQSGRLVISKINWASLTPEEGVQARKILAERMDPIDQANLAALVKMLPPEGWFSYSRYGRPAADAAFHIVQHGDTATQERILPQIEAMSKKGEADPESFAKMYDRVAIAEGRLQRYGTQFDCVDGYIAPFPLEDPSNVDARRRAIGLAGGFAVMRAQLAAQPCR